MAARLPTFTVLQAVALVLLLIAVLVVGCGAPDPTTTPTPTEKPAAPTPTEIPDDPTPATEVKTEIMGLVAGGAGLAVPPGFGANVFFLGLSNPTSIAVSDDGVVYVSQQDGAIAALRDTDLDGEADSVGLYARGFPAPLGLAHREDTLYVSSRGSVTALRDSDRDGQPDDVETIVSELPTGIHQNNGLAFGPDGRMYLTLGSTCNACRERSELSATILQFNPDGSDMRVYARGLRNVYDIAFHPMDGTLFGADNGRDELELNVPEELNLLVDGGNYGWPDCWGDGQGSNCEGTLPPIAEMEQRSSANGLLFYTGSMFPAEYTNDLFIAQWGSHLRDTGRKIVRVELEREGESYRAEVSDFALGIDRPLDVAQAPDGSLLVADYGSGTIYRIYWKGQ